MNRCSVKQAREGDLTMRGTSGVLVFALVVMGFMAFGYNRKDSMETARTPLAGDSMAQPVETADKPKEYRSRRSVNACGRGRR